MAALTDEGMEGPMVGRYAITSLGGSAESASAQRKFEPFELEGEASSDEINPYDDEGGDFHQGGDEQEIVSLLASSIGTGRASKQPQVYFQRWIQLGYLSGLAMLSDWICFSVAASAETFEELYGVDDSTELIDWFLFTNVVTCFLVTDFVAKFGLQRCIQTAAIVMAVGTWCRALSSSHYEYRLFVTGTLLVGAAQPFFQCTPPLLSALWFASNERATATAVALNFNQIGIATAFLVGGPMAGSSSEHGLRSYFWLIAVVGTLLGAGTCYQFQAQPPIPPSWSELEKQQQHHEEPPFRVSAKRFLQTPGFAQALSAFICSISITNIVGALIEEVMHRGGVTKTWQVSLVGGVFEFAIVLGGVVLGRYVDRTKQYKSVTLNCLWISMLLLLPLGMTDHRLGKEPVVVVLSCFLLGFFTGPIQPINAELAVDVTFPGDETAVESVQQIGGNLVSALLMPCAEWATQKDFNLLQRVPWLASDIRGDILLLSAVTVVTLLYFSSFSAPLKRTMADRQSRTRSNTDAHGQQQNEV